MGKSGTGPRNETLQFSPRPKLVTRGTGARGNGRPGERAHGGPGARGERAHGGTGARGTEKANREWTRIKEGKLEGEIRLTPGTATTQRGFPEPASRRNSGSRRSRRGLRQLVAAFGEAARCQPRAPSFVPCRALKQAGWGVWQPMPTQSVTSPGFLRLLLNQAIPGRTFGQKKGPRPWRGTRP